MKRWLVALCLLCLPWSVAQAQDDFIFEAPAAEIDEAAVRAAAQPLLERGATIAIYVVSNGGAEDVLQRLEAAGLLQNGVTHAPLIAIYVSLEPRYSEIRYGGNWQLQAHVADIRTNTLNPQLQQGQFTAGLVNTLQRLEEITRPSTSSPIVNFICNGLCWVGCCIVPISLFMIFRWRRLTRTLTNFTASPAHSSSTSGDSSYSAWSSAGDSGGGDSGGGSDGGDW